MNATVAVIFVVVFVIGVIVGVVTVIAMAAVRRERGLVPPRREPPAPGRRSRDEDRSPPGYPDS